MTQTNYNKNSREGSVSGLNPNWRSQILWPRPILFEDDQAVPVCDSCGGDIQIPHNFGDGDVIVSCEGCPDRIEPLEGILDEFYEES